MKIKTAIVLLPFLFLLFSCSTTPMPDNSSAIVPEDFFGMVHAGNTRTLKEHRLLDKMGAAWVLSTFAWRNIENEKRDFNFILYDLFVDIAITNNKKIVGVLAYDTPWLTPTRKRYISPENIPHFLNYVEKTVRHFKGRVTVWEIWNEPNFTFWNGPNNEFYNLSRLTAQKILETDPDATILGGAFWRAPVSFIKNMNKAGALENIDGIAFHPYAINPQGSMKIYDRFLKTLAGINFTGPIWITEIGYPTGGWYPSRVSNEDLPAYVIKTIAGAAARGARTLFWYELFDTFSKENIPVTQRIKSESFFGLVYRNYERKDGSWAYELCARYLPGSRYIRELPQKENIPPEIVVFCFLSKDNKSNTLIIWNDKRNIQKANINLADPAFIHNISTGESTLLQSEAIVDIGTAPLFITWQGNNLPHITKTK